MKRPRYNAPYRSQLRTCVTVTAGPLSGSEDLLSTARPVDALDRAIIRCLQQDGRTSSAEIARQMNVAERTVRARIDRLISDSVIRVVASIVPATAGYVVTADVFLEVEAGRIHDIATFIASKPEVGYVGLTTGDRDISIQIHARSVEALYDFVTNELGMIPGVVRTNTFIIPKIIKTHFDFTGDELDEASARKSEHSN
jgi:Lrp/AsnC family transcriptional regulator, regulator for asnA, asnC and gidA